VKAEKTSDPAGRIMNGVLRTALDKFNKHHKDKSVRVTVDVDPVWML
jgi:hypothetical protein